MNAALSVDALRLTSREDVEILRDVAFEVARGERVALIGSNGAGKTSTLRCVARFYDDWSGAILLDGRSVRQFSTRELARKIAVVRQISDSFGAFTARQIVEFGRLPYLKPFARLSARDAAIVDEALERVNAKRFAERALASLSGGERQKILLAAAFAQEPELLLLDEPTTFLDLRNQAETSDAISCWLNDKRAAVLETTHELNRAALCADRVVALTDGRVTYDGAARTSTSRDALRRIYGVDATTVPHPATGTPMLLPDVSDVSKNTASNERKSIPTSEEPQLESERPKKISPFRTVVLTILVALILFVMPMLGKTTYSPRVWAQFPTSGASIQESDAQTRIFWGERLPKTILAALAGAGLALAGLTLQTLFRNSLATPYTLGIASGASLGAAVAIQFSGALVAWGLASTVSGAATGAILSTALVYATSRRARSEERVLLSGVAIAFFFSSLVLCLQYVAKPTDAYLALRWTIGSLDLCEPCYLATTLVAVLIALAILIRHARELDAVLLGDERAKSLGVDVPRLRQTLFGVSSVLVGVVVAFCGPIGFVGLTAPHLARLFVGVEHRRVAPVAALIGAAFLGVCYTVSRIVLFPSVLPVGIVTSLLGGPIFLWALLRRK